MLVFLRSEDITQRPVPAGSFTVSKHHIRKGRSGLLCTLQISVGELWQKLEESTAINAIAEFVLCHLFKVNDTDVRQKRVPYNELMVKTSQNLLTADAMRLGKRVRAEYQSVVFNLISVEYCDLDVPVPLVTKKRSVRKGKVWRGSKRDESAGERGVLRAFTQR